VLFRAYPQDGTIWQVEGFRSWRQIDPHFSGGSREMGEGAKLVWHRGKLAVSFIESGKRYRRSLGTDDIATARQRMAGYLHAKDTGNLGKALNVADVYQAYMKDRKTEGKSITRMEDAWKRLAPTFSDMPADAITKEDCWSYRDHRRETGASDGTIHLELGYLRAALVLKFRDRAPDIPLPQKPPPREYHITKEQAKLLLASAVMPHVKLFIVVALSTAGRAQAILDLTWDRVSFEKRVIDLRDPTRGTTNKGRATPPMNDMALSVLQEARKAALTRYVIEWGENRVQSVKKGIGEAGRRAGFKVTPHVLRHSAAVWMAEQGVPIPEIGQYLGHTNLNTTYRVYARYSPNHLRKAAEALEF
jgi:integrase